MIIFFVTFATDQKNNLNFNMKIKIIFIVLSWIACVVSAQTAAEKKLPWDYPIKPDTEEWKQFHSKKEMVDACQIPENILSALSTEELTDICLQYPLFYDIFSHINLYQGFDQLFNDFNGIRELFTREDAYKEILIQYQTKMQNLSYLEKSVSDAEKGLFIISISALEVILGRYQSK